MHDTITIEHTLKCQRRQKLSRDLGPVAAAAIAVGARSSAFVFFSTRRNNEPANREHESESDITSRTEYRNWTPKFLRPSNGFRSRKKSHIMEIKTKVRNKCSSLQLSVHFCFSRWSVRVVLLKLLRLETQKKAKMILKASVLVIGLVGAVLSGERL